MGFIRVSKQGDSTKDTGKVIYSMEEGSKSGLMVQLMKEN